MRERPSRPVDEIVEMDGQAVRLAKPMEIPPCHFVGRTKELAYCETAWRIDVARYSFVEDDIEPLHFRLEGPPGVGKNEIIYHIARRLKRELYVFQGHEEVTPEDLALHLVPDQSGTGVGAMPLVLRASSLATAIYKGGLFFFDEINRVPERALSPLASVLDGRQYIESAMTGLRISPVDDGARRSFRFACALNSGIAMSPLPAYLEQRTLPRINVGNIPEVELREILHTSLSCPENFLNAFTAWFRKRGGSNKEVSIRQAKSLMRFAMRYREQWGKSQSGDYELSERTSLEVAAKLVFDGWLG